MNFVKHLRGRNRQRATQEAKAGGDSQWRPRLLSVGWDLDNSAAAGVRTAGQQANSGGRKRRVARSRQSIGLQETKTVQIWSEHNQRGNNGQRK